MILLLLGTSCHPESPEASLQLLPLSDPQRLRRASLDLRGVLPSADELDQVAEDGSAFAALRDDYLADPAFEERLVTLLSERWRTRVDVFDIVYQDYGLPPEEEFNFERSVGEEPLRLMAHVAAEDLPWTEIVTADYTLANELLAEIWPLDYPDGESGWQKAYYTDGRPAAGVLASEMVVPLGGSKWEPPRAWSASPLQASRWSSAEISMLTL